MSVEDLDRLFNQPQRLSFSASAVTGNGVLQTLTACCKQVLQDLKNKSKRTEQGRSTPPQPTIEHSPEISPTIPVGPETPVGTTAPGTITTNEIKVGTIPEPPVPDLNSEQSTENDTGSAMADKQPPFAFPGTPARDLTKSPQPGTPGEPFIPEVAQVGKARIVNPYTITVPIRLATDPDQQNMLNIDITLAIKDFCKTI
jgi:hypothetical protein